MADLWPGPVFRWSARAVCAAAIGVSLTCPASISAQLVAGTDTSRRVTRIEVTRHDIFDSTEASLWVRRIVNKLHIRTRQRVVERELLLRAGEPLDSARAAETGRNLRRLQVFRDVRVDTSPDGTTLRINTYDGWSTRPYATLRSTGGQTLISAGLLETNFLGLASTLDMRYVQDPDRSLLRFAFGAPRLFRNRVSTGAFYNRFSDGGSVGAVVEQPYFSLSSRNAWRAGFVNFDGRVLRFRDGVLSAQDSLRRLFALGTVAASHAVRASPRGYLRLGTELQLRRDDFAPQRDVNAPIGRLVTGAVLSYVDISKANFLLTRNYRLLGQPEDVDLSSTIRLGVAIAPRALGYARSQAGPLVSAQTGVRIPHGFVIVNGRMTGLASGGVVDSGTAQVSTTIALQPHPQHMLVGFTMRGWDRNPFPGEEFDLGLTRGPRAFPLHAFTGDRQQYSLLEYRYTAFPDILRSFAAGVALFAETGGAWYSGTPKRTGSDVGAGLRYAPLRSASNVGAGRFDLAYRFATDRQPAGWVAVIGTGFTFDFLR
ncbi:MAG: hypothetical protein U5K74_09475 [Gemmatimonadaceae bacterium]|nr:hypothetical protein [Gemmatimonadaceae bacterium]